MERAVTEDSEAPEKEEQDQEVVEEAPLKEAAEERKAPAGEQLEEGVAEEAPAEKAAAEAARAQGTATAAYRKMLKAREAIAANAEALTGAENRAAAVLGQAGHFGIDGPPTRRLESGLP